MVTVCEVLRGQRAGHQALHVLGDHEGVRGVRDRDRRQVVHDHPVGLLVGRGPRVGVGLAVGRGQRGEHLGRAEGPELRLGLPVLLLGEERADEVVGVVVVTGPPEQVDVGLPGLDRVQVVRAPGQRRRLDGEAGVGEVLADDLEHGARVGQVGPADVGRVVEPQRGAHRPGLGQQLAGLVRVVVVGGDVVGPPVDGRRHELDGRLGVGREQRVHDGLPVDRVGDGLPHPDVLQRGVGLGALDVPGVDAQVQHVERVAREDLEAVAGQGVVVGRGHQVVAVDGAGLQLLAAGVAVRDGAEDDLVQPGRVAPVVRVALEGHHAVAAVPAVQHERAGAGGVLEAVGGVAQRVAVAAQVVGVVLLQRRGALHGEAGQRQHGRELAGHLGERDDRGRGVRRLAPGVQARGVRGVGETAEVVLVVDRRGRARGQAGEVVPAVEVGAHHVGVELGAVAERDALAQVEGVGQPVLGGLVALGQGGGELGAAGLGGQQALVDLPGDAEALPVLGERGVQHGRLAGGAEDERAAGGGVGGTGVVPVAGGAGRHGQGGEGGRRGGQHTRGTTEHRGRPAFSAHAGPDVLEPDCLGTRTHPGAGVDVRPRL